MSFSVSQVAAAEDRCSGAEPRGTGDSAEGLGLSKLNLLMLRTEYNNTIT